MIVPFSNGSRIHLKEQVKDHLRRLEWGLFSSQGSFEGVDKDKLEETLREANKSFSLFS